MVDAQHSPQRSADSFGIVIERERAAHELDGLRWYTDFARCETVLWEKYFHCADLGRDLVPVVEAFKASDEDMERVWNKPDCEDVTEEYIRSD